MRFWLKRNRSGAVPSGSGPPEPRSATRDQPGTSWIHALSHAGIGFHGVRISLERTCSLYLSNVILRHDGLCPISFPFFPPLRRSVFARITDAGLTIDRDYGHLLVLSKIMSALQRPETLTLWCFIYEARFYIIQVEKDDLRALKFVTNLENSAVEFFRCCKFTY